MSFFSSIFGGKNAQPSATDHQKTNVPQTKTPSKGYPSVSGLYPHEIILLSMAEKYKTNETKYPDKLRTDYGIGFPKELFSKLFKGGYIRAAGASDSLNNLKLVELKAIAEASGVNTGGEKSDLCERISNSVSEHDLENFISERYWKITEKGEAELRDNMYLDILTGDHTFSLQQVGIDILFLNKMHNEKPQLHVRDVVWGELNRISLVEYKESFSSKNFSKYCEVLRTMALFLEEEQKHSQSLSQYCRYIHYNNSFRAGFAALNDLMLSKDVYESTGTLYMYAHILPFESVSEIV